MREPVISAKSLPDMIDFLLRRRSSKVRTLGNPGPEREEIDTILRIASRVPDHGKLAPWRFIVMQGDGRRKAGDFLRSAFLTEDLEATPAKLDLEAERFERAPLVIAVVSSLREGKAPEWEQVLSSGAACFNLCLAANALGFATTWLTEWYAYNDSFKASMGLKENERFAGFVYIGTATGLLEERERPELRDIVTYLE